MTQLTRPLFYMSKNIISEALNKAFMEFSFRNSWYIFLKISKSDFIFLPYRLIDILFSSVNEFVFLISWPDYFCQRFYIFDSMFRLILHSKDTWNVITSQLFVHIIVFLVFVNIWKLLTRKNIYFVSIYYKEIKEKHWITQAI
jgi:hypothetical protein